MSACLAPDGDSIAGSSFALWPGDCEPQVTLTDGLGGLNPNALLILAATSFGATTTSSEDCGPVTEDPFPNAAGIWLQGWDDVSCFNALWDPDLDGVHNGCETRLPLPSAQSFA
jgi:hypothetical protein